MLEKDITGTKLRKKVKNTKVVKSIQQFLLSEKPINWVRFLLPLSRKLRENGKVGQNFIRNLNLSPLIIYPLKTKLLKFTSKTCDM